MKSARHWSSDLQHLLTQLCVYVLSIGEIFVVDRNGYLAINFLNNAVFSVFFGFATDLF